MLRSVSQGAGFILTLIWAAAADSVVDLYGFTSYIIGIVVIAALILLPDKLAR